MIPDNVRWYDYYNYNSNSTWDANSTSYDSYPDLLSSYIDDTQIENILVKIINCDYTIEKNKNAGSEAGAENNNGSTAKVKTMARDNNDVAVYPDNSDQGTVCGISQSDLKAAMLYTQKGFHMFFKL